MKTVGERTWEARELDPLKLLLDPENPRVDIPRNATQDTIRRLLLREAQVADLAKQIVKSKGLLHGERVIVTEEAGTYIVLEGNRRIAALQMLLQPRLISDEFRNAFPHSDDAGFLRRIRKVSVDVAPDRDAAEISITKRHTSRGILRWVSIAQYRRIKNILARQTKSLDEIADLFGISRGKLTKLLRSSALHEYLYEPSVLNATDRKKLEDPRLRPTAFTRFFELTGVPAAAGISFSNDGAIVPTVSARELKRTIGGIARALLIPGKEGKVRFNTRATPQEVFSYLAQQDRRTAAAKVRYESAASHVVKAPVRRVDAIRARGKFFEPLKGTSVGNEAIDRFIDEAARIRHTEFPTASAYLARAMLEGTLRFCIETAGLWSDIKAIHKGHEPSLKELMAFCESNHDRIFSHNVRRVLQQWQSVHKDYCDLVVHGNLFLATPTTLEKLAAETRPFIHKALSKEILRLPS